MVELASRGSKVRTNINLELATQLVQRYFSANLHVTRVSKLYGGSINCVLAFQTDGQPASLVAKLHAAGADAACRQEMAGLRLFCDQTDLPVPEPYACMSNDPDLGSSGLLMEWIDGRTLADARLSPGGFSRLQQNLARHIAALHQHTRSSFGLALDRQGADTWLAVFQPMIHREFTAVRQILSAHARGVVDQLIDHLDRWLVPGGPAVLVHGDLWATNIMVNDRHPDQPHISAFLDGQPAYCDPEYELAYLRLFRTADETFFKIYQQTHRLRGGFERRCRVYWLNTMMMHVRIFGQQYLPMCEQLVREVEQVT